MQLFQWKVRDATVDSHTTLRNYRITPQRHGETYKQSRRQTMLYEQQIEITAKYFVRFFRLLPCSMEIVRVLTFPDCPRFAK